MFVALNVLLFSDVPLCNYCG